MSLDDFKVEAAKFGRCFVFTDTGQIRHPGITDAGMDPACPLLVVLLGVYNGPENGWDNGLAAELAWENGMSQKDADAVIISADNILNEMDVEEP